MDKPKKINPREIALDGLKLWIEEIDPGAMKYVITHTHTETNKTQVQRSNNFNDNQYARNARDARNLNSQWIRLIWNHIQKIQDNRSQTAGYEAYLRDITGVIFNIIVDRGQLLPWTVPIQFGFWDPKALSGFITDQTKTNANVKEYIELMKTIGSNSLIVNNNIVYLVSRLFFIRSVIDNLKDYFKSSGNEFTITFGITGVDDANTRIVKYGLEDMLNYFNTYSRTGSPRQEGGSTPGVKKTLYVKHKNEFITLKSYLVATKKKTSAKVSTIAKKTSSASKNKTYKKTS